MYRTESDIDYHVNEDLKKRKDLIEYFKDRLVKLEETLNLEVENAKEIKEIEDLIGKLKTSLNIITTELGG